MSKKLKACSLAVTAVLLLSTASAAWAEDLTEEQIFNSLVNRKPAKKQREPSEAEIEASLKNMRIVQKKQDDGATPTRAERDKLLKSAEDNGGGSVGLAIEFGYRSAKIEESAMNVLEALGKALSSKELREKEVLIAGHADKKGDPQFNLDLSQARADAVKDYLVSHYKLSSEKLIAVGYGFEHLKFADDPLNEGNRRVEVINLAVK